jgi:hypothetical protein
MEESGLRARHADGPEESSFYSAYARGRGDCIAFRKHSLLPLDDCLFALREQIPHLSRSSLHRLFQRNGISKLPENEEKKPKKKFKKYPIGYFHIDITEVRTEASKL